MGYRFFSTDQIKNVYKVISNLLIPGGYCRVILTLGSFKNWRMLSIDSDLEEWFYDVAVIDDGILNNAYQVFQTHLSRFMNEFLM